MPDLSRRSSEEELMDDLTLATEALRQNLDELEVINTWLGGYRIVTDGLSRLKPRFPAATPLQLADLGSGGGDTLRVIARWARRQRLPVVLTGIDANTFMLDYAAGKSRDYPEIGYEQHDVFSDDFRTRRFDVLTCSLFCHHFPDEALVRLLRQLREQARVGVIINDLHRHPLAYHSIKWLTRLFGGSYLVQNDAPLSVARAFSRQDWQRLLHQAGIETYELRWLWAFRWQVIF
ncbi:methyltransferase domain-containing protein [Hymenobacter sp. BT175]|uniref:methyltransferase domain-containing protein n=1 Tax=Hymenobacter translucens TaxID=2886507 RepID=UPI001D0E6677|nr:methyltransferase domain-containing protein [Hymenobacter translucens]MCC2547340.1 methyltransferase domain-containing protein [Hymenobacter translucens]